MTKRRPLIAANWKMHGTPDDVPVIQAMGRALEDVDDRVDSLICPPFTLLAAAAGVLPRGVSLGAQDCHANPSGAHTGCVSAVMIKAAGACAVIVGHSERRADHGETSAVVHAKALAAAAAGLWPVICVGETLAQRQEGQAESLVASQIMDSVPESAPPGLVLAYEPVWAIGTGLTPTLEDIAAMHAAARAALAQRCGGAVADQTRILYGGSVKPENAAEILAVDGVDGALVGGASLKLDSFLAIVRAHPLVGGL
jgi:triosephosphate isomerase (TIM)